MNRAVIKLVETLRAIAGDLREVRRGLAPDIADELLIAEQALERAAARAETVPG